MFDSDIFNKFTKHLKNSLKIAGYLARQDKKETVEPLHLLDGIIQQPGSLAAEILHKNGLQSQTISSNLEQENSSSIITLELNQAARKTITKMLNLAFSYRHLYIGTEHLLMALILSKDQKVQNRFKEKNISQTKLRTHLEAVLNSTSHFSDLTDMFSELLPGQPPVLERPDSKNRSDKSLLELFTVDLTDSKLQQQIDPVIGREKEIERLIQILARRHKNNPLLLGDPGVGKTALVEGLAKKITQGKVPEILKDKRILNLDLGLMLAGTMYRGEFESRLKNILEEIKQNPDIIIFIDELHNIIGAGSTTGGTMDAANLIKPALGRGEIRCIGATTMGEYRKHIESDPALERRFQTIQIKEPSATETLEILQGLKKNYEKFHNISISKEALETAVDLSLRYISDKFLPDKAIDLVDEAASRQKINTKTSALEKKLKNWQKKLVSLEKEKSQAIAREDYDQALHIKNEEQSIKEKLHKLRQQIDTQPRPGKTLTSQHIAEVVSQLTHIPFNYLSQTGDKKIQSLEKTLNKYVIGQTDAISSLTSTLKRAQLGLLSPDRPIGSFLFLGPSGVGKTELAKILAEHYFGNPDALIRIDMSEFSESFNISKLIGAPAGYVGYKEGGKITDAVRRRPYSVVLFDEIEKGHPDVFNLLLQILDEGFITDAEGRKINFRHTIIILTSNLASEKFNLEENFGFVRQKKEKTYNPEKIKNQVLNELEQEFKPELLNRLDSIVVFNALDTKVLTQIVKLRLNQLQQRLNRKNINLDISSSVYKFIADQSYHPNKGAREIRRNLEKLIEQPLAEIILKKPNAKNFQVKVEKKKLTIRPRASS